MIWLILSVLVYFFGLEWIRRDWNYHKKDMRRRNAKELMRKGSYKQASRSFKPFYWRDPSYSCDDHIEEYLNKD